MDSRLIHQPRRLTVASPTMATQAEPPVNERGVLDEQRAAERRVFDDATGHRGRDYARDIFELGAAMGRAAMESAMPLPSGRSLPQASRELTVALVVDGSGGLTTDDAADVQAIVDQIDELPHLFAERYLKLERDHAALVERVNGLCAREVV